MTSRNDKHRPLPLHMAVIFVPSGIEEVSVPTGHITVTKYHDKGTGFSTRKKTTKCLQTSHLTHITSRSFKATPAFTLTSRSVAGSLQRLMGVRLDTIVIQSTASDWRCIPYWNILCIRRELTKNCWEGQPKLTRTGTLVASSQSL